MTTLDFLNELGIEKVNFGGYSDKWLGSGSELDSVTPVDGTLIAKIKQCNSGDYENIMQKSSEIFKKWRMEPAPKRGEVVRNLANAGVLEGVPTIIINGKYKFRRTGDVQRNIDNMLFLYDN